MRVIGYRLFPLAFAFAEGRYTTSYGRRTHLNSLLLELQTDVGIKGYGEICRKSGASPEPADPVVAQEHRQRVEPIVGVDPLNIASVRTHLTQLAKAYSNTCLLYTSPSPRDRQKSRMPSSA